MKLSQDIFNFWFLIAQALTAGGLIYFAWRQTQINKRMKQLADYVAISISPGPSGQIQIQNVGRSNLYLHKWEIGRLNETFVKPWLLPTEGRSKILIAIPPDQIGQHLAKFYLTDEIDQKYLSTGEVTVEATSFKLPNSTTPPATQESIPGMPAVSVQLRMRAWSYKTEKYDWKI